MRSQALRTLQTLAIACALIAAPSTAFPQSEGSSCPGDDAVSINQWLAQPTDPALSEKISRATSEQLIEDEALAAPRATQVSAAGGFDDALSLVSGAGVPTLLAFAAEKGLASSADGKITLNLSPFDLIAAVKPEVIDKQSSYERLELARRFGLTVTLGGKGDSFDRDGDGEADDALEAQNLGDVVAWEARFRLAGTRDRRDPKNYSRVFQRANEPFARVASAHDKLVSAVMEQMAAQPATLIAGGNPSCLSRSGIKSLLSTDLKIAGMMKEYEEARADLSSALANAKLMAAGDVAETDREFLLTLFAGGLSRADDFGPDKRLAGLRAAWGGEDRNLTLNLEWNETESSAGEKPTTWKAGLEYAVLLFKGGAYKDGIQVAGSGVYEKYENVPLAKHDTVARLGAKLELPVGVGVKIPISVTWANHPDLIEGESEIRGHIGFTFDLSQIKKPTSQ